MSHMLELAAEKVTGCTHVFVYTLPVAGGGRLTSWQWCQRCGALRDVAGHVWRLPHLHQVLEEARHQ